MPHIRVRGMERIQLANISKELIGCLEEVIGCPRDHFTLDNIEKNKYYENGCHF
ncbi:MAG: DUF1904 family protein [Bacillota bacterium]